VEPSSNLKFIFLKKLTKSISNTIYSAIFVIESPFDHNGGLPSIMVKPIIIKNHQFIKKNLDGNFGF